MAAHQGNGAHAQAQPGVIQAEQLGEAYAHKVLHRDHDGGQQQEHQHRARAPAQHLEAGPVPYTGEEPDHEHIFQRLVKGQGEQSRLMDHQVENGEDQPSHHGGRDAAAPQESHVVHDKAAQHEQQHGQPCRLEDIQFNGHLSVSFSLLEWPERVFFLLRIGTGYQPRFKSLQKLSREKKSSPYLTKIFPSLLSILHMYY